MIFRAIFKEDSFCTSNATAFWFAAYFDNTIFNAERMDRAIVSGHVLAEVLSVLPCLHLLNALHYMPLDSQACKRHFMSLFVP